MSSPGKRSRWVPVAFESLSAGGDCRGPRRGGGYRILLCGLCALGVSTSAMAQDFDLFGLSGSMKNRLSEGMGWRVDRPDTNLIYKDNLNPGLCGTTDATSCYATNGSQANNAKLVAAPGAYFGANRDQGDLNYRYGNLTSAVTKFSTDLTLSKDNWVFKAGALAYFDPHNYSFENTNPDTTYQPYHTLRARNIANDAGKDWVLKDLLVNTKFSLFDHDFNTTVGYQHIRWGESTLIALNSVSEINAPDARLLYQPGTQIAEVFRPTPAVLLNTGLPGGVNLDAVYMFGWDYVHIPAGGEFYSLYNVVGEPTALLSLGQFHMDPNGLQRLPSIGADISDTSFTIPFEYGTHARSQGQFGFKLNYYSADLNNGTEFDLYFLNYHSRLPYLSFVAANATCIQSTSVDFLQALNDCKGFKALPGGLEPFPVDSMRGFLDYPEDIHMIGFSFNTTVGKWSLAGEMSYRPNLPVQVHASDLLYTAGQPALPAHNICFGLVSSVTGIIGLNTTNAPSSCTAPDGVRSGDAGGALYLAQLLTTSRGQSLLGTTLANPTSTYALPTAAEAIPSNFAAYRGWTVYPNQIIHGYDRLQALQFDISGLHLFSSTENPIGADQVILITELGAMYFPDMPSYKRLQFETGDFHDTHYSPGADGSGDPAGTPVGRQPDGSYAAARFTPTMQNTGFATAFSTGYRIILRGEYDNIFALGWNYKPQLIWSHDIYGRAPLPMQNFNEGNKTWQLINDFEITNQWVVDLYYQGSIGGGTINYLRDKATAGFIVNYTF
jgi:hypothetical protein